MGQTIIRDAAPIAQVKALAKRRRNSMVRMIRLAADAAEAAGARRMAGRKAAIREIARRSARPAPAGTARDHADRDDAHGLPK